MMRGEIEHAWSPWWSDQTSWALTNSPLISRLTCMSVCVCVCGMCFSVCVCVSVPCALLMINWQYFAFVLLGGKEQNATNCSEEIDLQFQILPFISCQDWRWWRKRNYDDDDEISKVKHVFGGGASSMSKSVSNMTTNRWTRGNKCVGQSETNGKNSHLRHKTEHLLSSIWEGSGLKIHLQNNPSLVSTVFMNPLSPHVIENVASSLYHLSSRYHAFIHTRLLALISHYC